MLHFPYRHILCMFNGSNNIYGTNPPDQIGFVTNAGGVTAGTYIKALDTSRP